MVRIFVVDSSCVRFDLICCCFGLFAIYGNGLVYDIRELIWWNWGFLKSVVVERARF